MTAWVERESVRIRPRPRLVFLVAQRLKGRNPLTHNKSSAISSWIGNGNSGCAASPKELTCSLPGHLGTMSDMEVGRTERDHIVDVELEVGDFIAVHVAGDHQVSSAPDVAQIAAVAAESGVPDPVEVLVTVL